MVLLVFLIDTSASMNQRTCLGTTFLDIAKGAVESFVKIRTRDLVASRGDRYMLVTFDEPPTGIKAGWRENHNTFMEELKNITATGLSDLGQALKETFDLLNMHRLQSGIDNYGMGRNPHYLEPAVILTITDGCSLTNMTGATNELHLPMQHMLPGSELTQEPFRWDQRMFSIILRLPGMGSGASDRLPVLNPDEVAINAMSEVTGGKSYVVPTYKSLMQSLESVVQKIQRGVVINFEKIGPAPEVMSSHEGAKTPTIISGNGLNCDSPTLPSEDDFQDGNRKLPNKGLLPNGMLSSPVDMNDSLFRPIKTEGISSENGNTPDLVLRGVEQPIPLLKPEPERVIPSPGIPTQMPMAWQNTRRMIYVKANPKSAVGHWPIPESFWPDPSTQSLMPRNAQPIVKFSCADAEPMVIDNLPFDKYELEPSPLTQFILERKQPTLCWQTFVSGSGRGNDVLEPFGYLKASTNLQAVNFFVLPYNYPVLLPLLDDLFKLYKFKPPIKWRHSFEHYLSTMPMYYAVPLRNALHRMGAPGNLIPDHMDGSMSYSVVTYLKKVKAQAKMEAERLVNMVLKWSLTEKNLIKPFAMGSNNITERTKDYRQLLLRSNSRPTRSSTKALSTGESSESSEPSLAHRGLPVLQEILQVQSYKNVFDIPRYCMVEHVGRMRVNFFRTSASSTDMQNEDAKHTVSIAQMGNYQEYLRVFVPLRDVDPGQARLHAFGNPFRLRRDNITVDESDVNEAMTGPGSPARKRVTDQLQLPGSSSKKRKRSETPPPTRRPQGPPNTPPPNVSSQSAFKFGSGKSSPVPKSNSDAALKNIMEDLDEVMSPSTSSVLPSNPIVVPPPLSVTPPSVGERNHPSDKKPLMKAVNRQLKRLQDLHRSKQGKFNKGGDKVDLPNGRHNPLIDGNNVLPISNIIRTSLEADLDRGEPRSLSLNNHISADGPTRSCDWMSMKSTHLLDAKECRLQLQRSPTNVQLRACANKEVRSSRDWSRLTNLIGQVEGPLEVKQLFTTDVISEAEKFKLSDIVVRLKLLVSEMHEQLYDSG